MEQVLIGTEEKRLEKSFDVRCPPFVATTTNKAFRITINSYISVIEYLLFEMNFKYVLTGKFNQDCIEVGDNMSD